jgi:hypothetical protein
MILKGNPFNRLTRVRIGFVNTKVSLIRMYLDVKYNLNNLF